MAEIGASLAKQDLRYVVIAARGTSDNAARYAQYVFGAQNRLTVALATPSLYSIYLRPPRLDGALVIGISQSGQSPDMVSVLQEARRQGAPTVAVTNEPQSPLTAAADHVIELHAGHERSVAATKTYTAQLAALGLLSLSMTGRPASTCVGRGSCCDRDGIEIRARGPGCRQAGRRAAISVWSWDAGSTMRPHSRSHSR